MPRLGGSNDALLPTQARNEATAYANSPISRLWNVVLFLALVFVLRNILFHDYRSDEVQRLKATGKTEEEIEKYIPKTAVERKKLEESKLVDFLKMKEDVAFLLTEVERLKAKLGEGESKEKGDSVTQPRTR